MYLEQKNTTWKHVEAGGGACHTQILISIMSDNDDLDAGRAPHCGSRRTGVPNYQNNILIRIVERLLPNGNEGWRLVALAYKEESGEENLRLVDDLKKTG